MQTTSSKKCTQYKIRQTVTLIGWHILALSSSSHASFFTDVGDETLRYYLSVLDAHADISIPITTWPIAWLGIREELKTLPLSSIETFNRRQQRAYQYVKRAAQQADQTINYESRLHIANSPAALLGFDADARESYEASTALSLQSQNTRAVHVAGRINIAVVEQSIDDEPYRFDGSYLGIASKAWSLGYGAIDRWWGPGWQSSLVLSHNARPTRGFFLQRQSLQAADSTLFSWLGAWQLTLFANTLEEDRYVPQARLLGFRFAFQPAQSVELGIFRTAQWGGEGRPETWESFGNLLIGNDNQGSSTLHRDTSDQPGNQQAGVDINIKLHTENQTTYQLYTQVLGEDEAQLLPSRTIALFGVSSQWSSAQADHQISVEYTDTLTAGGSRQRTNYAYEHKLIYLSGYRYLGRPIGAAVDNDSRLLSVQAQHFLTSDYQINWKLLRSDINRDGSNLELPRAGNVWGDKEIEQWLFSADIYKSLWFRQRSRYEMRGNRLRLGLGVFYVAQDMRINQQDIQSGGFFSLHYKH